MASKKKAVHPHAKWIRAWLAGEQVQYRNLITPISNDWIDVNNVNYFVLEDGDEFRIAPKTVKTIGYRRFIARRSDDGIFYMDTALEPSALDPFGLPSDVVKWIDIEWQYAEVEVSA